MAILQFILDLIFGNFRKKKGRPSRRQRRKSKKALLRARNRRLHRIFMSRSKELQEREKPLTIEKLIERSIRKGKKRSKMKWQKKVQLESHVHTARQKDLEQRKASLRERVKQKRDKATELWAQMGH